MAPTRALLLSTYIKWVNVFPEIKPQLLNVFERYRHVLDVDLQQRACEFYALAQRPEDDELLQNVCEEIPPFPPRESTLLSRLNKKHGDSSKIYMLDWSVFIWLHREHGRKGCRPVGAPLNWYVTTLIWTTILY